MTTTTVPHAEPRLPVEPAAAAAARQLLEDGHLGSCPGCGDLGPAGETCSCCQARYLLHLRLGEPYSLAA